MARKKTLGTSRHGRSAPGWKKLGLQVPVTLIPHYEEQVGAHGDTKHIGTAAMSLFHFLPPAVREDLKRFTAHATLFDVDKFEPSTVYERFCHLMGIQQAEPAEPPASIPMQRIAN